MHTRGMSLVVKAHLRFRFWEILSWRLSVCGAFSLLAAMVRLVAELEQIREQLASLLQILRQQRSMRERKAFEEAGNCKQSVLFIAR